MRQSILTVAAACTLLAASISCVQAGQLGVLYAFPGGANGAHPQGALATDSLSNLFGSTQAGGTAGLLWRHRVWHGV